jgi:hypothetical protein
VQRILTKEEYFAHARDENNAFDLSQLLLERGVNLNDPSQNIISLPLQAYDDSSLEQVFVDDYIDFEGVMFDGPKYAVTARIVSVLYNESDEPMVGFREAEILGVDGQRFKVVFEDSGERRLVPRVYVYLDHENPHRWCDRFTQAWRRRQVA